MPADDKEVIGLLRKCEVLAESPLDNLQAVLPGLTIGNYRPRQVIYLPGRPRAGRSTS